MRSRAPTSMPIRRVIEGPSPAPRGRRPERGRDHRAGSSRYTGDGTRQSHPDFDGMPNREALSGDVAWLDRGARKHASVNYRLRRTG